MQSLLKNGLRARLSIGRDVQRRVPLMKGGDERTHASPRASPRYLEREGKPLRRVRLIDERGVAHAGGDALSLTGADCKEAVRRALG